MKELFSKLIRKKVDSDYKDFYYSSLDGFLFTDENGYITEWNTALEKIIGTSFEKYRSSKIWDIPFHFKIVINNNPVDFDDVKFRLQRFFETGKSINDQDITEIELLMPDNTRKWIHQTSFRINTPKGFKLGASVRDITQQKQLEFRLRKNENTFHDLERLFDTLDNYLFIVDMQGDIIHVNDVVIKNLEYSYEELIKKPVVNVHPKNRRQEAAKIISEMLRGRQNSCFIPFETKCGRLIPVETHSMSGKWGGRDVLIGTSWDISKILITERALSDSETKYKNLIENTGEGIGIVDSNEVFVFANEAAEIIFGEKKGGLVGKSVLSYISAEENTKIVTETQKRKKGEKSTYELTIRHQDGTLRSVLLTATPSYNDKGEITGTMGIFRDNTDLKNALDLMKIAKEKAEENDRIKSAFLSTMSHELRTPLNAIIGLSEIIKHSTDWNEIHEFLQMINSQGNGLLEIIESIFEIIQLETEEADVDISNIMLDEFFSSLTPKFKSRQAFHKKETVELIYQPDTSCQNLVIRSDQKKLKIMMINLVDNALKFTKEGFVEYGFRRLDDGVEFYVKDSGIGIDESKKHVIFERFRQVDDSHTREFGGIGLGLAVCRKISELMGANLDFISKPGEGTTFLFELPGVIDPVLLSENSESPELFYPDLSQHKILVAEDDKANMRLITFLLEKCRANLITAYDGKIAQDYFIENPDISLAVMDINMPGMDGTSVMKLIKKINPSIPVIALTAYALPRDKRQFKDAGFDDLITKPIRNINLIKVISKFLLTDM